LRLYSAEDDEEGCILVRALAELLRPKVVAAAIQAKQALFSAQAEDRRRRMDTLQHKIDEVSTFVCAAQNRLMNVF
jgi:hypothetical protein